MKCGKQLENSDEEYCIDCVTGERSFEYGLALLNYDELSREIMSGIKYKNKREHLELFANLIVLRYADRIRMMKPDAIVPVPLHKSRLRQRGYNQTEILAEYMSSQLGIKVCRDVLFRKKKTKAMKELSADERLKNLKEAFVAGEEAEKLYSVLIVDDIYTTGSTVEACTIALKTRGVQRVYFISICIGQS